jgi:hypothetical protein
MRRTIMTINEWAEKLTGREYGEELTKEEEQALKADGLVAAFGASDDLLEFRGALHDEAGAWDGTTEKLCITDTGEVKVFNKEENQETAEFNRMQIANMKKVEAIWSPRGPDGKAWASWEIRIYGDIPYATFDIMEDGDLYCRGIVFEARHIGLL